MLNQTTAALLARYKAWADDLTLKAVAALPPHEVTRERSTVFKSILGTLNHIYVVDSIWTAHLEGRQHGFTARNTIVHPDVNELWKAQQELNASLLHWCNTQSDATLAERVDFKFVSGEDGVMTRGAILLHIVNHATYHRGWISDLFFQIPAKPPATDLSVFPEVALHETPDADD
jgi:uncharacterized damage-inducible protein DinB